MVRQFSRPLAFAACALLALLATLATAPAQQAERSPAGAGARFPSLARAGDGRVAMVWMERDADSVPVLKTAIRGADGRWSPARAVVRDSALFVNFADYARVAFLSSGELVVTWLQRNGAGRYDYGIRVARSADGGATWGAPAIPYDASERGEHGFVALVPMPGGRVALSFLNGAHAGRGGGAMHVNFSTLGGAGLIGAARTLDDRACDCCQTATAMTSRGPIVTYRDRSAEEIRDIVVTRQVRGEWTPAVPVANDGWRSTPARSTVPRSRPPVSALRWPGSPSRVTRRRCSSRFPTTPAPRSARRFDSTRDSPPGTWTWCSRPTARRT